MASDAFADRVRDADLDRYLATLYAPEAARPALFALHALDLELLSVALKTREPMVGLIRLAWWREALEALDRAPPPAEPLLRAVADRILPRGVSGRDLAALEPGYAELMEEVVDVEHHLAVRGETLFTLAARVIGGDGAAAAPAGRLWAAGELVRLGRDVPPGHVDAGISIEGAPAPLRALARLAKRDLRSKKPARRGSASRQLRLLWGMLSGA